MFSFSWRYRRPPVFPFQPFVADGKVFSLPAFSRAVPALFLKIPFSSRVAPFLRSGTTSGLRACGTFFKKRGSRSPVPLFDFYRV